MLQRFAASVAESRDWAAYWEITGEGKPSPDDYVSDDDFWFNLPANFDVLDAFVRMMRWSGDAPHQHDPAFKTFATLTMSNYLKAWQLEPGRLLNRPRIANRRLREGRFVNARGIPSYSEGTSDFLFGSDLLAAEYRAMKSFREVSADRKLLQATERNATAMQALLERVSWSEQGHHYYGMVRSDLSAYGSGDTMVLYFGATKNPERIRGALDYISSPTYWKQINIEEETYIALILFRYGRIATAYQVLEDITGPQKARREYPEVSFSVVDAIASGVMGLVAAPTSAPYDISTLSRLPHESDKATLSAIPIKHNEITVSHNGLHVTRLKNVSGPSLRWRVEFAGRASRLRVGDHNAPIQRSITPEGITITWADVTVQSGQEVEVRAE
ncbi:hypothetical protein [Terriglobus sp. ADX1]|uniref:hypothetical protein n=1 Tax=Terriglobus sp. ADX1 TaxID=2794063 RepID=UPI002FE5F637